MRIAHVRLFFFILFCLTGPAWAVDTTPPVITIPGDITIEAGSALNYPVAVADNVGVTSLVLSAQARFREPRGVCVDKSGNVYVADASNHVIRKITSGGVVSTLAGKIGHPGSADGTGSAARFNYPCGVCVDGSGTVYVADSSNHVIRKITSGGVVSTLAGKAGFDGSENGTGSAARFSGPIGLCVDGGGNVYVADTNNSMIRKITSRGVVSKLAGPTGTVGIKDGFGSEAQFGAPSCVAVDGSGNVYVADTDFCAIRKLSLIHI
jgi:hypothetical protein